MLAVKLNATASGTPAVELVELPRPEIQRPTDAILMVTTTAVGPWEIKRARETRDSMTPGAQFAGIVVEVGEAVTAVDIDDLVVAICTTSALFGTNPLPGGHAEYVRVPNADLTLLKTTPAAEERAVFAGGAASLGFAAANLALERVAEGSILVLGCDAAGLCVLAWIKHRRGKQPDVYAFDSNPARLAAGKSFGARVATEEAVDVLDVKAVIAGCATTEMPAHLPPGAPLISTNPCENADLRAKYGADKVVEANWSALEQARRAEMAIRLRQVDLTSLVSTVVPLDEAAEGYRVALESPPGTRSVLLKP
jgi:threonine dehydrogenase-like Zn-dependent dehydrogenase